MLSETGVDGCSIARGAIGNPFIFRELRSLLADDALPPPPSIFELRQAIERHYSLMSELHGETLAGPLLRKFGVRYSELHPCPREVKMAFLAVKTPEDWRAMLDQWYGDPTRYPPVERRDRPEALIAAGAAWDCQASPA
jgi:tRNA-dihydrouridine synthase B